MFQSRRHDDERNTGHKTYILTVERMVNTSQKKSVILRIDPSLWNDLNNWAQDELRSVNGQIEYILREAVRRRKRGERGGGMSDGE